MSDTPPAASRPAVFFDRDGTLNVEIERPLVSPEQLVLLPGAAEAVASVNAAERIALVVTNQSAIARGWMTHFELEQVHAGLRARLAASGARLDGILHCPHLPGGGSAPYHRDCACRKPKPGLLHLAARRWNVDLARSWVIGDALRDLESGAELGVRGILVRTGKGAREAQRVADLPERARPFAIVPNVREAVAVALTTPAPGQGR
ncbi:MAG TPA: HAD family hydrolase [Planctomycetota bacterium]|nr:HAD family hydrolase [Planctomycetota bacterium]